MKMSLIISVVIFQFAVLVFSCGRNHPAAAEKTPEYLASFYVRYLEEDKRTKAEARFRPFDSDQKDFWQAVDKGVLFDGSPLPLRDMGTIGSVYTRTMGGPHAPSREFEVLGQQVKITTPKATNIRIEGEPSRSKGFRIVWDGPVLSDKETLILQITDGTGKTHPFNRLGPSQASNTPLLKEQLERIPPGETSLRVIRKSTVEVKGGNLFAGASLSEYYASPITFTLAD